jgi:spore coat polysaccharide biosynthesis protein SpsF
MTSTRLPGKILLPLAGAPLLLRMLDRVRTAQLVGDVIVATTDSTSDDVVAGLCMKNGIPVYRGHPTDLLDRHYQCAKAYSADIVLKIPSDCPLIDSGIIDRVTRAFMEASVDFASNLHPPTYPDGNDVEVMAIGALERAWREADKDFQREHTTPYIWDNPECFNTLNVCWETGMDYSGTYRFTIDYAEDYAFIKEVYDALYPANPNFRLDDILRLLNRRPEIAAINAKYAGTTWYRPYVGELKTMEPNPVKQSGNGR